MFHKKELEMAFKVSIPVMMGYIILGFTFGLLAINSGFKWHEALIMSVFIYAGALQFLAIGLIKAKSGFVNIFIASIMINIRQSFYGLSLLKQFKKVIMKPYLIFALTDETYALLTSVKIPEGIKKEWYYLYLSALNQLYWIIGTLIGSIFGSNIAFNAKGLDFSLTALFIVLTIEQYKKVKKIFPFTLGAFSSIFALIAVNKENMLLTSILMALTGMLLCSKRFKNE